MRYKVFCIPSLLIGLDEKPPAPGMPAKYESCGCSRRPPCPSLPRCHYLQQRICRYRRGLLLQIDQHSYDLARKQADW